MSARKAGQKVFDWAALAARAPEGIRSEFAAFRARHEACRSSMNSYSEKPAPIDWEYYNRNISKPNLVENFQKQFQALSVPYPKDTASGAIEERQKATEVEVKEAIAEAKKRMADLQEQLDKINAEKPLEEMTVEEYLADKPELKKKAEEDTYKGNWHMGYW